jgi:putative thioredoxin
MPQSSPWIIETTTATFERDIVEGSRQRPVVIDFWAPWCGPCQQLAPLLETLAVEYNGKFILSKVNVDEAPEIAGAFQVQSIPFVVAMLDGQPVNHFVGLLSEDQLRSWLDGLLPSPAQQLVSAGLEIEARDPAAAEAKFREAAHLDPNDASIQIHLARVLLALNRDEEARQIIAELEQRGFLEPEAERIKSQLELLEVAEEAGGVEEARKAAEANPDDLSLKLQLADALAVARKYEEALQICLQLIDRDKAGIGGQAKDTMVKIFDVLGPSSQLASDYRRKLATAWY